MSKPVMRWPDPIVWVVAVLLWVMIGAVALRFWNAL